MMYTKEQKDFIESMPLSYYFIQEYERYAAFYYVATGKEDYKFSEVADLVKKGMPHGLNAYWVLDQYFKGLLR